MDLWDSEWKPWGHSLRGLLEGAGPGECWVWSLGTWLCTEGLLGIGKGGLNLLLNSGTEKREENGGKESPRRGQGHIELPGVTIWNSGGLFCHEQRTVAG